MSNNSYDPGLTQTSNGKLDKIIREDGSFAVRRTGVSFFNSNYYHFLTSVSWTAFIGLFIITFIAINIVFALLYLANGIHSINGASSTNFFDSFASCFYFSVHTFTTVGYGNMSPVGFVANFISLLEILSGIMFVAIVTGLMYGRFSKPNFRLVHSNNILLAPYNDGLSLQFRLANIRQNVLMEVEITILLMHKVVENNRTKIAYSRLNLERDKVVFLPLAWTVVHPIDEQSPLYNKSVQDIIDEESQFIVHIKGFDDTFSQQVNSRLSYTAKEIVENAKFQPMFHVEENGIFNLQLDKIHDYYIVSR